MNLLKQLKTYFSKPQESNNPPPPRKNSGLISSSFQLIMQQILEEPPSQDFIILGQQNTAQFQQEGIENMYIKDFLLIGKKCQGKELTIEEWREVVKSANTTMHSKKDLYFSIFKGIDFKIRKDVWEVLANTAEMKKGSNLNFQELSKPENLSKSQIDLIDKDVKRTDAVTKSLGELRKILIAYVSLSGRSYTQGMNLIGGVLLRLLAIQNDKQLAGHAIYEQQYAERVFWVLMGVMKWKCWSQLFQQDLSGLQRMLGVLKELMQQNVPKILSLIQNLGWDLGIFAQYYITICLYNCPIELAPIILDLFLLDGQIVVHSFLIRMMAINQAKIMAFKKQELLMKYLKSQMLNDTYQKLIKNRVGAYRLQDFEINFLKTAF